MTILQMQGIDERHNSSDALHSSTDSERRLNMSAMHRILDNADEKVLSEGELTDDEDLHAVNAVQRHGPSTTSTPTPARVAAILPPPQLPPPQQASLQTVQNTTAAAVQYCPPGQGVRGGSAGPISHPHWHVPLRPAQHATQQYPQMNGAAVISGSGFGMPYYNPAHQRGGQRRGRVRGGSRGSVQRRGRGHDASRHAPEIPRCSAHRRRGCRRCSNVPLHVRRQTILREIADRIAELDGRCPTPNQILSMIIGATF